MNRARKFRFSLTLQLAADRLPRESRAKAKARITENALRALAVFWIQVEKVHGQTMPTK